MNELLEKTDSGGEGGKPPAQPVAVASPADDGRGDPAAANNPKPIERPGPAPKKPVYKFKPGTPEGDEERRQFNALRMALARASEKKQREKLAPPPALPSAFASGPDPVPATSDPENSNLNDPSAAPAVLWQADMLTDLVQELIDAAEENRVASYAAKCQQAGLMGKLVKEISDDAHFPKSAKVLLARSLPRLAVKWLNKAGISAEYQDEVAVVTALLLMIQHDRKTSSKLDELIKEAKKAKASPPPAAPAAAPASPGLVEKP